MSVSQSVTTTLLAGSSWTTHTLLFFYFEYGDYLCNVVFFSFVSCLPPGRPALEDGVLFPSLFTFASSFLSLILMRTDLGVEPSTRWKYRIRLDECSAACNCWGNKSAHLKKLRQQRSTINRHLRPEALPCPVTAGLPHAARLTRAVNVSRHLHRTDVKSLTPR